MKPFRTAMLCGRFQHIHIGHEHLIQLGLVLADEILVVVGSAQEAGTAKNPFSITTRIELIKVIYPEDCVRTMGLADLTNGTYITPAWGKYLFRNIRQFCGRLPDIMIYGNDVPRSLWFAAEDIITISELIVARQKLPVSATVLRAHLIADRKKDWQALTNPKIHGFYPKLRAEILQAEPFNVAKN